MEREILRIIYNGASFTQKFDISPFILERPNMDCDIFKIIKISNGKTNKFLQVGGYYIYYEKDVSMKIDWDFDAIKQTTLKNNDMYLMSIIDGEEINNIIDILIQKILSRNIRKNPFDTHFKFI